MTRDELAHQVAMILFESPSIINRARIAPAEAAAMAERFVFAIAPRGYLPAVNPGGLRGAEPTTHHGPDATCRRCRKWSL